MSRAPARHRRPPNLARFAPPARPTATPPEIATEIIAIALRQALASRNPRELQDAAQAALQTLAHRTSPHH